MRTFWRIARSFFLISVAGALVACSKDKGSEPKKVTPQTPDEAIHQMSAEQQERFKNWKGQVVKNCEVSDVFEGFKPSVYTGVDLGAMLDANNSSVVFQDGDLTTTVSDYDSLPGLSKSEIETNVEVNGEVTQFSARAEREGSSCKIYIFNQLVYETVLAKNIRVGLELTARSQAVIAGELNPRLEDRGENGMISMKNVGVAPALERALLPTETSRQLLATRWKVNGSLIPQLILVPNYLGHRYAYRWAGQPNMLWESGADVLTGASDSLRSLLMVGTGHFPVEARFALPTWPKKLRPQISDTKTISLQAEMGFDRPSRIQMQATRFHWVGIVEPANGEATQCFVERTRGLERVAPASALRRGFEVGVGILAEPCNVLHTHYLEKVARPDGVILTLLPEVFRGVRGSPNFDFGGWGQELSQAVFATLDQKKNLRTEIDPRGQMPLMSKIEEMMTHEREILSKTRNAQVLKTGADEMVMTWVLRDEQVGVNDLDRVLFSLDVAAEPFVESAQRMLNLLGRSFAGHQQRLEFALQMQDSYKALGREAFTLAAGLGETQFRSQVLANVIEKMIPETVLIPYVVKMREVQAEVGRYPSLQKYRSSLVNILVAPMVPGSVVKGVSTALLFSSLANVVDDFPESTETFLKSWGRDDRADERSLLFARELTPELKALLKQTLVDAVSLDIPEEAERLRKTILQMAPTPDVIRLRAATFAAAQAFNQREMSRLAGNSGQEAKYQRKAFIERALREGWRENQFIMIEAFAETAKLLPSSALYPDVSRILYYAGDRLFSTEAGQYLDPRFHDRYLDLAKSMANWLQPLSDADYFPVRTTVLNEMYRSGSAIWNRCDDLAFHSRQTELGEKLTALPTITDGFERMKTESRIRDLVRNCGF